MHSDRTCCCCAFGQDSTRFVCHYVSTRFLKNCILCHLFCKFISRYLSCCTYEQHGPTGHVLSNPALHPPVSEPEPHKRRCHFALLCLQTLFHLVAMVGSVVLYLVFSLIYNAACMVCNPPANPYWIMEKQLADPTFYLLCLLTPVVALLPRFA